VRAAISVGNLAILIKIVMHIPFDPAIPLWGVYPKEIMV
jgi:hypothetical protein